MACSKCPEETVGKHGMCRLHWNEYQANYKARVVAKRDKAAYFNGFEEGLSSAIRFLRENLGDRAVTGHQAAHLLNKALLAPETNEIISRRRMLEAIRTTA